MFKWFGHRKPDHPLADPRRAREVLAGLPASDAPRALDEIVEWTDSILRAGGIGLEDRIHLVTLLDEAGQPFHRKLLRDYLAAQRVQRSQEQRLWNAAFGFWKSLTSGYAGCLAEAGEGPRTGARPLLPLAVCRGIRATGQQLKWLQLRYRPIDEDLWSVLSAFYRFALERSLDRRPVDLYPHSPGTTDAGREMVKVLMLWSAAPDALSPVPLEIAERLTAHFSALFEIHRGRRVPGGYAFNLDGHCGPGRLPPSAALKADVILFGAGTAHREMERACRALEEGTVPPEIDLGGFYGPDAVLKVMNHLSLHWAPNPPERKHLRHPVQARLVVVSSLSGLIDSVLGSGSFGVSAGESWMIEDISASGFRATIPETRPDWIRIGALVGIRPEGVEHWGVAVIRRVSRDRQNRAYVGVQTMAHEAAGVRLRPLSDSWKALVRLDAEGYLAALNLRRSELAPGEVVLVAPAGVFSMDQNLEMLEEGRRRRLAPVALMERGEEFEIARFRQVM